MKTQERIGKLRFGRHKKVRRAPADPEAQIVFAVQQLLESTGKTKYLTPEESQLLIQRAEDEAKALLTTTEQTEGTVSESI